jgi:hypothetical protein
LFRLPSRTKRWNHGVAGVLRSLIRQSDTVLQPRTRRTELREIHILREMLMSKGGRDFALACIDNTDGIVPERITSKLVIQTPPVELVDLYLHEIAKAYSVDWAPESHAAAATAEAPEGTVPEPVAERPDPCSVSVLSAEEEDPLPSFAKSFLTCATAPTGFRLVPVRTNKRHSGFVDAHSPASFTERKDPLDPSLRHRLASDPSGGPLARKRSDHCQDQLVRERDHDDTSGGSSGGGGGEICCAQLRIDSDLGLGARTGGEWYQFEQGKGEGGRCVRGVAAPVCRTQEEINSGLLYSSHYKFRVVRSA